MPPEPRRGLRHETIQPRGVVAPHQTPSLCYAGGDRAWAEDVVQDVFVSLCRAIEGLENNEDLGGWLYRTTCNRCVSRLRRRALERSPAIRWLIGQKQAEAPSVESTVAGRQDLRRVSAMLDKLPAKQKVAFCMFHLDGKKVEEIGETLGHSKGYVSKLIARAEARIRADGWTLPDPSGPQSPSHPTSCVASSAANRPSPPRPDPKGGQR
ncbi:MAG: sigma-70 family RNA polymerase sigma factor [Myxococcales bacterium FL481]|nr:MAG: sigma-70 family RNA polymerase sigma factor [Myxococcales bacterium FL481]